MEYSPVNVGVQFAQERNIRTCVGATVGDVSGSVASQVLVLLQICQLCAWYVGVCLKADLPFQGT